MKVSHLARDVLFLGIMAATGFAPIYNRPDTPVGTGTARDTELERVRTIARALDSYFIDPLIGLLLPGGGDLIGSLLGMYIVVIAIRRRVSPILIARMLMNLAGDAIVGAIPLLGDVFDLAFKANERNVKLLETRSVGRARARDWLIVAGAALAFLSVIVLVIWGIVAATRALKW